MMDVQIGTKYTNWMCPKKSFWTIECAYCNNAGMVILRNVHDQPKKNPQKISSYRRTLDWSSPCSLKCNILGFFMQYCNEIKNCVEIYIFLIKVFQFRITHRYLPICLFSKKKKHFFVIIKKNKNTPCILST